MKNILFFLSSIFLISASNQQNFALQGIIQSESGEFLSDINVSLWANGNLTSSGKTNKYGEYSIPIFKTTSYSIIVGDNTKYFITHKEKEFNVTTVTTYSKNFTLSTDKHVVKHEATRLKESDNQMRRNPENKDYKKIFFGNFPSTMNELELFFNKENKKVNLFKEENYYFSVFFEKGLVNWKSYMDKLIYFSQSAYPNKKNSITQVFQNECIKFLEKEPEPCFRHLSESNDFVTYTFFEFLFMGKSKNAIPQSFINLSNKYSKVTNIIDQVFENRK